MRALGKGSVASFLKGALVVAEVVLWVILGLIGLAAVGFGVAATLFATGTVQIQLPEGHDGQSLLWLIAGPALLAAALLLIGTIIIVRRLKRLFDSFCSGDPFKRENADHLRVIWITMLAMELAKIVFGGAALTLFLVFGMPSEFHSDSDMHFDGFDLTPWISILVLIVLAEVFREGARLREEQDLTI